jgi:hypothetical protein
MMKNSKSNSKKINQLLIILAFLAVITLLVVIPYFLFPSSLFTRHSYTDQRSLCGLNNAFNVLSNLVLIAAGCYWLNWIFRTKNISLKCRKGLYETRLYATFFAAVILAGIQSAWYHLFQSQLGLLGTYLLSNIVMLSLLSAIIAERVNLRIGLHSCIPFIFISMLISFYWYIYQTDNQLSHLWYFLTYLIPSLSIMTIIVARPKYGGIKHITFAFCNTFIALGVSCLDEAIYTLTRHMISGQSLHNIYLGIAAIYIGCYLEQRSIYVRNYYVRNHQRVPTSFKSKIIYQHLRLPILIPSRASINLSENMVKVINPSNIK